MSGARDRNTNLPPGSRAPALAQTVELVRDPFAFFDRRRARFGPIFRAKLLGYPRLAYVAEPELARAVFATDRTIGRAGEVRREVMEPLVGEGYRERIAAIAAAEIERWPLGEPFALRPRAAAITLEVILQIVFGVRD